MCNLIHLKLPYGCLTTCQHARRSPIHMLQPSTGSKPLLNDRAALLHTSLKSQSGSRHRDHNVIPTLPTSDTSGKTMSLDRETLSGCVGGETSLRLRVFKEMQEM